MLTFFVFIRIIIIFNREAWNLCGDMSREEAMQLYIKELKQVKYREVILLFSQAHSE